MLATVASVWWEVLSRKTVLVRHGISNNISLTQPGLDDAAACIYSCERGQKVVRVVARRLGNAHMSMQL